MQNICLQAMYHDTQPREQWEGAWYVHATVLKEGNISG